MFKRILSILACGYILMFYSENVFWAQMRPTDNLNGYLETWLFYSVLAFALLTLIEQFKVKNIWALFLCGAVFGWLAEGVIVQTAYENLPLSISFTALAWHALISVWVGWYSTRKAIQTNRSSTLKIAAAIGLFYGLWAISWWTESPPIVATPPEFSTYVIVTTLLLIAAYWIFDWSILPFETGTQAKIIVAGALILYFATITIPTAPIALVVLPLLLLMVYLALRRIPQTDESSSLLTKINILPPLKNYLVMLIMPAVAITIYTLAYAQGWRWHTNWAVYIVTVPLGFIVLGISLYRTWRRPVAV